MSLHAVAFADNEYPACPTGELTTTLMDQPDVHAMMRLVRTLAIEVLEVADTQRSRALQLNDILRAACATPWAEKADAHDVWAAQSCLWRVLLAGGSNDELADATEEAVSSLFNRRQDNRQDERASIARQCAQFIEEHYRDDITLDSLAKAVHLSPTHVSRVMREELGMSFVRMLMQVRIEHAMQLMQDSQAPLYWVARRVGYKSPTYFSRVFRRTTGKSPSEFRR